MTTNPQTDDRARIAHALRSIIAVGGCPPNRLVPVLDVANSRMARIAAWQPLDTLIDELLAAVSVPASAPTDRAAKAESLLLRFAAEAHRRKWAYDRGLDDDGVPVKSEAFDALHQLGDEMRTALDELRRERAAAASGSGRVADETQAEGEL